MHGPAVSEDAPRSTGHFSNETTLRRQSFCSELASNDDPRKRAWEDSNRPLLDFYFA